MSKGIFLFIIANILTWLTMNLQFMSKWWADRPIVNIITFSVPIGLLFLYATKYVVEASQSYWAPKMTSFAISIIIYSLLTWIILKEGIFEPKTFVCIILSIMIMLIQLLWK